MSRRHRDEDDWRNRDHHHHSRRHHHDDDGHSDDENYNQRRSDRHHHNDDREQPPREQQHNRPHREDEATTNNNNTVRKLSFGEFPYPSKAETRAADDFIRSVRKQQENSNDEHQEQERQEQERQVDEADVVARTVLQHVVRDQLRDVRCRHVSPLEVVRQSDSVTFKAVAAELLRCAAEFKSLDAVDPVKRDKYDVERISQACIEKSLLGQSAAAHQQRVAEMREQQRLQRLAAVAAAAVAAAAAANQ